MLVASSSAVRVIRDLAAFAAIKDPIPVLTRAYALRGVTSVRPAPPTPVLALGPAWTGPEGALSSRRRADLRRARRRAQARGELTVEPRAPARDEVDPLLDEAIAVDGASWRASTGTALDCDAARAAFLRASPRRAAAEGRLRIGLLRIDGQAAAMQVGIELDERLWLLKIGFDRRFAPCSPGSLLLLEALRDAAARGLRACELLGTVEPWTAAWTQATRPLVGLRVRPVVAVAHGLSVRLVKGEHADPSGDGPATVAGVVALAHQLAGRARHVGVASHDRAAAGPAIAALRAAGTPCELELLLGLPAGVQTLARDAGVGVRVYVPWGTRAWVPYEATDPALRWRLLGDAAVGRSRWRRTLALRGAAAPRPQLSSAA